MTEIEYELTYLAKFIPKQIQNIKPKRIIDYYLPELGVEHPVIRIRDNGGKYEITKKEPVDGSDSSKQYEHTIILTNLEFKDLIKGRKRKVLKDRYKLSINGHVAEIDIFLESLMGLVVIDFEFNNSEDKDTFVPPGCCLADITQEAFIAGGMLAGKSYKHIEPILDRFNYKKLSG